MKRGRSVSLGEGSEILLVLPEIGKIILRPSLGEGERERGEGGRYSSLTSRYTVMLQFLRCLVPSPASYCKMRRDKGHSEGQMRAGRRGGRGVDQNVSDIGANSDFLPILVLLSFARSLIRGHTSDKAEQAEASSLVLIIQA